MKKTVVVGMSGGVDSSVAAALLKEQGYNVIGLFMNNWEETNDGVCCAENDYADALAVSAKLAIPCYSVNFSREYMERVFKYFLSEYQKGRTPNPDVLCNREIKFGPFKEYAIKMGADFVATGHYCAKKTIGGESLLYKPLDENKDQTYFLNQVSSTQLDNVIFPLENLVKTDVRDIAKKYNLVTAAKKDSTGICFIGERNFKKFLSGYLPAKSGVIKDLNGRVLGNHEGLMYYTLGQRRGLGIGGIKGEQANRWYVVAKDLSSNTLIVSCGEGDEILSDGLKTEGFNWIGSAHLSDEFDCTAKFRYRQAAQQVKVVKESNGLNISFYEPQRAVTPGQYAVLYDGGRCLGGGVIASTYKNKGE